jgi:hypothetical protein
LPSPGISLCQSCETIDLGVLKEKDGYIHSESYWALAASAEQCPLCAFLVEALRGAQDNNFDQTMKLYNPLSAETKIIIHSRSSEKGPESIDNAPGEVRMISVSVKGGDMVPRNPGKLTVFALQG